MAGTNITETQLQTGEFELTTVGSAVKDSGIINVVTLEEGEQGCDDSLQVQGNNRQGGKWSNIKCHQGTQTELSSLFAVFDIKNVPEQVMEAHY